MYREERKGKITKLSRDHPHEDQDRKWEGCNSPKLLWVLMRTTYLAAGTCSYGCSWFLQLAGPMRACQTHLIISKLGYPFAISAILSSNLHACTDLVQTSPLPTNNKVLTASTYWYFHTNYEGVFPRSKSLLANFLNAITHCF
jgi:hypothetical protein